MAEVETKHAKFLRISEGRVARAEESIRLLENLSSRDYEPGPGEAAAMIARIDAAVDKVRALFGLSRPVEALSADEDSEDDLEAVEGEDGEEPAGEALKPGYVIALPKPRPPKTDRNGHPFGPGSPPPRHLYADLSPPGYPTPAEDDMTWRFHGPLIDAWMAIHQGDNARAKEILAAITSS